MKLALIIIAVLVVTGITLKIYSRISAKREQARWNKLTPDEQRIIKMIFPGVSISDNVL